MLAGFIIILSLYSPLTRAAGYQIDLIVFAHQQNAAHDGSNSNIPFMPLNRSAIALTTAMQKSTAPYQLLNPSQSALRDEYYQLTHKADYKVLGSYSWRQPAKNQSAVALPSIDKNGWQVQGTFKVQQSNYYTVNADLQASSPANPQATFSVKQKQRLKDNTVYYLDHEQIGMLVKIHKVS